VEEYAIGTQAVVKAPKVKEIEVFLDREMAPGFFAWLVPTSEDNALVGLLSRDHDCNLLDRFLHTLLEEGKIETVLSGPERWGVPMKTLPRMSRSRVLVVGDAAGQVKPMTGGGIYYGLLAGRVAAETLDQGLVANDLSDSSLSLYEKECHKLFGEEMEVGYTARGLFELLGNKHLNYLITKLSDNRLARGLLESPSLNFDWHSKPIKTLPRIPFMKSLLRLVGARAAAHAPKQ
jgi:digeranylgeranylglycerophospholipid reductase